MWNKTTGICNTVMEHCSVSNLVPMIIEQMTLAVAKGSSSVRSTGWPLVFPISSTKKLASSRILSSSDLFPRPKSLMLTNVNRRLSDQFLLKMIPKVK